MGNGSAVDLHTGKEQDLSKPNLISTDLFVKTNFQPTLKRNLNLQLNYQKNFS